MNLGNALPRFALGLVLCLASVLVGAMPETEGAPSAQPESRRTFLRIATGPVWGTYFPVGETLARVLSQPEGSSCDGARPCGVRGVTAVATASEGAIANVRLVANGFMETGLVQADIAHEAYEAKGFAAGGMRHPPIRAIANLYPEAVHVVVARTARIKGVADLRGKRVAIQSPRSGSNVEARRLLAAYGLNPSAVKLVEVGADEGAGLMAQGKLDALILVGGWPIPVIADMTRGGNAEVLALRGRPIDRLIAEGGGLLHKLSIPPGAYGNDKPIETVGMNATWIVNANVSASLVEQLCKALWRDTNRSVLKSGHPMGALITLEHARDNLPIPLHEGAERCYAGLGVTAAADAITTPAAPDLPTPRKRPATPSSQAASK